MPAEEPVDAILPRLRPSGATAVLPGKSVAGRSRGRSSLACPTKPPRSGHGILVGRPKQGCLCPRFCLAIEGCPRNGALFDRAGRIFLASADIRPLACLRQAPP